MNSAEVVVNRFRFFFIYSIDLGYLLESDIDIQNLQNLRARDALYDRLCAIFDNRHITASTFNDPCLETERIRARTGSAISKGGKNIWSDLFFKKQVPIRFKTEQGMKLSPAISAVAGENISLLDATQTKDTGIRFNGCDFRIFREGTLSFTFEFSHNLIKSQISVSELIHILDMLEAETFVGYLFRIKEVIRDWSNPSHEFRILGCKITSHDNDADTIIRTSTVKHSCLFLESVTDVSTKKVIPAEDLQSKYLLLGILNKARWYELYSEKYIENAFSKNVGYRRDEIYLTDKDSSLILLADYWNPSRSLQHYIYDLTLALEFQIAKIAYLDFILNYMQANPSSRDALTNPSGDKAISLVLQARNILTLAQEAVEINAFIIHGFTRRFIGQLAKERNLKDYMESIERRIENISGAIELKSSIDISKQGISIDQRGIKWAIFAVILGAFFNILEVILFYIVPWIQQFIELKQKQP